MLGRRMPLGKFGDVGLLFSVGAIVLIAAAGTNAAVFSFMETIEGFVGSESNVPTAGMTFTVTSTAAAGGSVCGATCSLQQAISASNANPPGAGATNTIAFNIPASDPNCNATTHVCTIMPTAELPLPAITQRVTINGYTQPGASSNTLANGDDAVLLIELDGSVPNVGPGLRPVGAASGSVIKGLVIDHNWGFGILVQTDTVTVEGCFIGIDPSGTVARGNSNGVFADFNQPTSGMRIGGTTSDRRNVISSNNAGIYFQSGSNHVVQGNFIGTDRTGTAAIPNGTGIQVQGSDDALIGGTTAQARNIIVGSTGIVLTVAARGRIQGNFIGTDVTGTADLGGNTGIDVDFAASASLIGGLTSTPGMPPGNVISGSTTGLQIGTGSNNVTGTAVMGNLIGTDAAGTGPLGNLTGVGIADPSNTVGGTDPMARNIISGNGLRGILIQSQNNQVQGNFIGTDITGTQGLGNGGDGVIVQTSNNTIGGISPTPGQDPGNRIAENGARGVNISSGTNGVAVLGNLMYSNGSLGIDLGGDGISQNDHCDDDGGANNLQNFPTITSATFTGGMVNLSGNLDSIAGETFRLEFFAGGVCDSSGNGEGRTLIGSTVVTTDGASCVASFGPLMFTLPAGPRLVTATATRLDSMGLPIETSEFSQCIAPSISGTVTYGNSSGSPQFVSNVLLSGAGMPNVSALTNFPGGSYSLSGFGAGSYTVTPSKTGGVNGAISSFDAARIALHVSGPPNPQLNPTQLIVADVSGNGAVTSFDAGMIAKFVAGPPYAPPGIGSTATWRFSPTNRNYASVGTAIAGEDYSALLMGEV